MLNHLPSISVAFTDFINVVSSNQQKQTVLVIGSGWGSTAFVESVDKRKYNVQVVSQSSYRLNQPRLIPDFNISYKKLSYVPINDKCISVQKNTQSVLGMRSIYDYDYLVIATGSEPNDFGTKGVKEHCLMFKTDIDLIKLKKTLDNKTRVTVIGAGPTGIELAFKLESLGHKVTILEASSSILPGFSLLMQSQAMKLLEGKNIKVTLNMKITEVSDKTISTPTGITRRDEILIWTCGVKPTVFVRDMTPEGRQLKTDGNLMFEPNIYAIGDVVTGHGPPTAQNAKQQGIYLANHFNNNFISKKDYKYNEKGRILDTATGLLVEYNGRVITLPPLFRTVFYYFTD